MSRTKITKTISYRVYSTLLVFVSFDTLDEARRHQSKRGGEIVQHTSITGPDFDFKSVIPVKIPSEIQHDQNASRPPRGTLQRHPRGKGNAC